MNAALDWPGSRWLECLRAAGCEPPLLIIADNRAIALFAPAWDSGLTVAGWSYRVRVAEFFAEAGAVAAEARGMFAAGLLAVGSFGTRAVARAVAEQTGLPLAVHPHDGGSATS